MPTAENKLLTVLDEKAVSASLTRREMARRLLAAVSASALWPLIAESHPILGQLQNDMVLDMAENLASDAWKAVFLNAQQNETLIAVAEAIIPGSGKAQVNRFIDLLLSVDRAENQRDFTESLAAFEAKSQSQFAKGFPALENSQKTSLLTDASEAAEKKTGFSAHFENLKGWVTGAYYSSEMGMRELGWTGDYAFEKFPGCEHPEGHH